MSDASARQEPVAAADDRPALSLFAWVGMATLALSAFISFLIFTNGSGFLSGEALLGWVLSCVAALTSSIGIARSRARVLPVITLCAASLGVMCPAVAAAILLSLLAAR